MEERGEIHIGTSGWNYKHWREVFYPKDLDPKGWLKYYAEKLNDVELNNTFYQLPAKRSFEQWKKTVPCEFSFAVKGSRFITHMKKLKDPKQSTQKLFERVETLQDKLGPILFQLPPRFKANPERLDSFLNRLPRNRQYAFEFRDHSWWKNEIFDILIEHKAAFCIYDLAGTLSSKKITSPHMVYIRLHGPGDAYEGRYSKHELASWAGAINSWIETGRDVYIFFDNDQDGYAPVNAIELREMLS